uniref:Uncharacterized protein n=1 Tax=Coturnix japonica TaxID=93934 RepID=A0A8C2T9G9_COTJA
MVAVRRKFFWCLFRVEPGHAVFKLQTVLRKGSPEHGRFDVTLQIPKEPDQIGVSFLSLLGDGFTCCSLLAFGCSLAAFVSRTPSLCCCEAPPRFSASSSSCCSDLARCNSRSCTRSSMMASRSSWIAWFR